MSGFKYDIVTLIELIESKPCIWDKTNQYNRNRILREKSWQEVFQSLDSGYKRLLQAEKKNTGEIIMNKWANIRDAFMKSLKTKDGQTIKRRYIYSNHLQFLLKGSQSDVTEDSFSQAGTEDDSIEEFTELPTQSQPSTSSELSESKRQLDNVDPENSSEVKKLKQSDGPILHSRSDQEILLLSFLPYIRDMNETELMDFQMDVLTNIKRIKQQRILNQTHSQHQHVGKQMFPQQSDAPLPSSTVSLDSYQSWGHLSPTQNQMENQQEVKPSETFITRYTETNKYEQPFD